MTPSPDSTSDLLGGPEPALDRRTLERLAVGAPPPAPSAPPRAIERGARVRAGWPARPLPLRRATRPRPRPERPIPEIAIGRPRERARPAEDLSFEPLYLLVPDPPTWASPGGPRAALAAARRFAGGRPSVLVDLDPSGSLSRLLGGGEREGVADVLEFGLSLDAPAIDLEGGVRFVPLGAVRDPAGTLFTHAGWKRLIRTARRRGDRILAYVPPGPHLDALLPHAGAALLLAGPDDEPRLRAALPPSLPVVGAFEPPPAPALPRTAWETAEHEIAALTEGAAGPGSPGGGAPAAPATGLGSVQPATAPAAEPPSPSTALVGIEPPAAESEAPPAPAVEEPPAPPPPPPPPARRPEPPMLAPTARGLTLAEWLAEEEEKLRELEAKPHVAVPDEEGGEEVAAAEPVGPESATVAAVGPDSEVAAPEVAAPGVDEAEVDAVTPAIAPPPEAPETRPAPLEPEKVELGPRVPHRYSVPRTSPRAERLIRVAAIVILAYWTYYIAWRWTSSLNLDALWFSVPLALAETWGWVTACFLVFTVWRLNHRKPPPAPAGLSVDVFITTFDEPLEVIRRTTISAREIRYPHATYVLDDGRREEVRAMARSLGVGYITRQDNAHAKAGNLNNALKETSGDFILQLDADHAPLPHILDRLLGFFNDPRVAFVQTPQDFYNLDSFTSHVDEETQRVWEEQKLFFSVLQPGKDHWNAAFFCGSCGVLRRAALEEIGGFSVQSVTEDVETSMLLHARHWKSVYYGESLAYGLAASSATAFHIQQGRWAQGSMQILRKLNPLTLRGLTPAQRLGYFYSLSSFAVGLQKFIFYGAPLVFFFTGILPIRAVDAQFLGRFLPYLVLSLFLYELLARGLGFTWIAERYQMAKFWTYTRALPTYLTNRRLGFRVTPKGPAHVPFRTYGPHIGLMVLTVVAVYWATFAYARGWVDYPVPGWESLAFQANFLWAGLNFVLAAYVVRLSIKLQHKRQDHRFSDRFPIYVQPRGSTGRLGERQLALTENLNASGVSFRSVSRFDHGTALKLTLPLSTREVTVEGTVVHVRPEPEPSIPAFIHGVEFRNVPLDVRDAIEIHCTHHAVPFRQMQYTPASSVSATRARPSERRQRRSTVRLPAWVLLGEGAGEDQRKQNVAFLEEIGPGGASLIMNEPVPPETPVVFEVPGTRIRGEGHTTYAHAMETPIGVRFVVGVRIARTELPGQGAPRSARRFRRAFGLALFLAAAPVTTAAAQFVAYGSAEADSRDQSLLLLGATLQAGSAGTGPFGAVLAYRLRYPSGDERVTVDAIAPSVGVVRVAGPTVLQLGLGYLLLATDAADALGAPGGGGEGVLVNAFAQHAAATLESQLTASYNFGDRYLWVRGRGGRRVPLDLGPGRILVGGEAVFQGGGSDAGYHSFQAAPFVELPLAPSLRLLAAIGWKTDDRPQTVGGGFPYYKLEFTSSN